MQSNLVIFCRLDKTKFAAASDWTYARTDLAKIENGILRCEKGKNPHLHLVNEDFFLAKKALLKLAACLKARNDLLDHHVIGLTQLHESTPDAITLLVKPPNLTVADKAGRC